MGNPYDRSLIPEAEDAALPNPDQKPNLVHISSFPPPAPRLRHQCGNDDRGAVEAGGLLSWLANTTVIEGEQSSRYSGQVDMKGRLCGYESLSPLVRDV